MSDLERIQRRIAAIIADLKAHPDDARSIEERIDRDHQRIAEFSKPVQKTHTKTQTKNAFSDVDL